MLLILQLEVHRAPVAVHLQFLRIPIDIISYVRLHHHQYWQSDGAHHIAEYPPMASSHFRGGLHDHLMLHLERVLSP